jgi:hypothetical protein
MKKSLSLGGLVITAALAFPTFATAAEVTPLSYTFDQPTSSGTWSYHDNDHTKLTDGIIGNAGWAVNSGSEWVGWNGKPVVNIDFDFGVPVNISDVAVGTAQDHLQDVVLPSIQIYQSNDNSIWSLAGSLTVPASSANNKSSTDTGPQTWLTLSDLSIVNQFVRISLLANGPWTFADEIKFTSDVSAVPVPAAVWLFGSGLVGLVGFNRKRAQSSLS